MARNFDVDHPDFIEGPCLANQKLRVTFIDGISLGFLDAILQKQVRAVSSGFAIIPVGPAL